MMDVNSQKVQLSKSILEMKFMKKTKEKIEQQLFQAEGEEYFENQLTIKMKQHSGKFIAEPSFMVCEQLTEGRFSFQGMNPDIERILEKEQNEIRMKHEKTKETDITDVEMAKHFKNACVTTLKKKFQRRKYKNGFNTYENESTKKKRRFLKPMD